MEQSDAEKKAVELLFKGATMLNIACPVCRHPIYRMPDKTMICAYCDKKIIREEEKEHSPEINEVHKEDPKSSHPIKEKIDQLAAQLQDETDPEKIMELAETIKKLEKILNN